LAAEYETLPKPMRSAVIPFFDENRTWLAYVLKDGCTTGTLKFAGPEEEVAHGILSTLEGAVLIAGPYGDIAPFKSTVRLLLSNLSADATGGRRRLDLRDGRDS
jgi:TetR/AcrR family transcriptional regulator, transcriptional repressor for nem operon